MNLIPVFAIILGMVFLGERVTASLLVGGGLVTLGLYLAHA
jgi:drug/metabolite transporter (DMT)-like permease